ncbi:hypothetical protein ETD83_10785 [Actinomadura soli]|uniref:Uncharacterized protein n=1 Tax=Actinomadura soli TaxID=2508997 RepID=A0A5C4JF93_9ACTN|nr:hypothetical protein ETD83_10785 [Actinomadura soli]
MDVRGPDAHAPPRDRGAVEHGGGRALGALRGRGLEGRGGEGGGRGGGGVRCLRSAGSGGYETRDRDRACQAQPTRATGDGWVKSHEKNLLLAVIRPL